MPNDLTGAFDVVAEFSLGAVNRILAAMHSLERLPHSLSVRVEKQRPPLPVVDFDGLAIADPARVASTGPGGSAFGGASGAILGRLVMQLLDPVVNTIEPTHDAVGQLIGAAQIQTGAPTVSFPTGSNNRATVHIPMMAQYTPDPNTFAIPRFLAGEIQVTLAATEQTSPAGRVMHIDFPLTGDNIRFVPSQALGAAAVQAIDAALESSLHGTFQPSNTPLPDELAGLRVFTQPSHASVALLMSLAGGQPVPGPIQSFNSFFLAPQDQFAVAASADFLKGILKDQITSALGPSQSFTFHHNGTIVHASGTGTLGSVSITFHPGHILLTLKGHVHVSTNILGTHDSDITMKQKLTLALVNGRVTLQLLGDLDVDASSAIFDTLDFLFNSVTGRVRPIFQAAWQNNQAAIQAMIGSKLSTALIDGFLAKLIAPVSTSPLTMARFIGGIDFGALDIGAVFDPGFVSPLRTQLNSVEIREGGVVLHANLTLTPFPAPHAEFDVVPNTQTAAHPEYSALKSWIPGGTIQSYVWSYDGQNRPPDGTKFFSTDAPGVGLYGAAVPGGICVSFTGSRISATGAVVTQTVSGGVCHGLTTSVMSRDAGSSSQGLPDVALVRAAAGKLEIVGHSSPWAPMGAPRSESANVLVHFPDARSIGQLDVLEKALKESGRTDVQTSILCVLAQGQLEHVKPSTEISFADDAAGWEKRLQVQSRPCTVLLSPAGKVMFRLHEPIEVHHLAQLLKRNLSAKSKLTPRIIGPDLRRGGIAPNFLFEFSAGKQLTLRKLAGKEVVLLFYKSTSQPSVAAVAQAEKLFAQPDVPRPVLLAIDSAALIPRADDKSHRFSGIVVPDPKGEIAQAYGVSFWPTLVFLDARGVVAEVRHSLEEPTGARR